MCDVALFRYGEKNCQSSQPVIAAFLADALATMSIDLSSEFLKIAIVKVRISRDVTMFNGL